MQSKASVRVQLLLLTAIGGVFTVNVLLVMIGPLLVDMARDLKVSVAVAGQLIAFMAVPWLIVAVLSGPISDAYGRKPVLLVGLGMGILGAVGAALAWNFAAAAFFRALSGMVGVVPTNVTAVVSDHVPVERRSKAIGYVTFGAGLGGVLGVPLMTLLADAASWRWSFVAASSIATAVWLLILLTLPSSTRRGPVSLNILSRFRPLLRQRVVWNLTMINTCQRTGLTILVAYFASYLIIEHGFSTGQTAVPMAIVSGGMILASVIGGVLGDTRYYALVGPIGLGASAAMGITIFGVNLHPVGEVAIGFLYAASVFVLFPIIAAMFSIIGGDKYRGTALGMVPISNQMGSVLGPALGGLALTLGGFEAVGVVCLVLGVLGAILSTFLLRRKDVHEAGKALASE